MNLRVSTQKLKIRERLLHEYQQGYYVAEARRNICQALGYEAVKQTCAKKWFLRFHQGDTSTKEKPRSGRPWEVDRPAVLEAVEENPTLTTRMLAIDFRCSNTEIEKILHAAGLRVRQGKWVPHDLKNFQKKEPF